MIEYLIVGSGFTASVICIHLIDTGINPKKITVIGPTKLGQGNAFNCPNDEYRLNVRSEIMWIYPENKLEFTSDLVAYETDTSHIEEKIIEMKKLMDGGVIPELTPHCQNCNYIVAGSNLISA